ncbi:hypothetical protein D3C81_1728310 [compost metagenome]
MLAIVPADLERFTPLHRSPGIFGDDGDAAERVETGGRGTAFQFDDLDHTRHFQCVCGIKAAHLAAHHHRSRHDGVQHAGQAGIYTVLGIAGDDILEVDAACAFLADVAELGRFFQA